MRAAAAFCLLAVMVAGCGAAPQDSAEEFSGEQRAVAAVVERLEEAARDDEATVVCSRLLSDSLLETLRKQGTNCRTGVREAFRDADSLDLTVDDVEISGDNATAKVKHRSRDGEKTATLEFERDGNAWKISSLGSA